VLALPIGGRDSSLSLAGLLPMCESAGMDRDSVLAKLRQHAPELRASGVVHLRLHGSLARGTASTASDVDLIAEFDPRKPLSLLDMVGLELHLSDILGARVDLSPSHTLRAPVRDRAASEAVLAF
jgi:uncharacterized protein